MVSEKHSLGVILLADQGNPLEISVRGCLKSIGISLLLDWDVLIYLYRHGLSLLGVEQISHSLNCDSATVGNALDRLESRKLIELSRSSKGVRFYKAAISSAGLPQSCVQQLEILTGNRSGRLMLRKILKPDTPEMVPEVQSEQAIWKEGVEWTKTV